MSKTNTLSCITLAIACVFSAQIGAYADHHERRIVSVRPPVSVSETVEKVRFESQIQLVRKLLSGSSAKARDEESSPPAKSGGRKLERKDAVADLQNAQALGIIEKHSGWAVELLAQYEFLLDFANNEKASMKKETTDSIEAILNFILVLRTAPDEKVKDPGAHALQNPQSFMKHHAGFQWSEVASLGLEDEESQSLLAYRELLTHALIAKVRNMLVDKGNERVKEIDLYGIWAGSKDATSDIDVNLKGNVTELAVPVLNEQFRKKFGSTFESGIVWDVNFYAADFLPSAPEEVKNLGAENADERQRVKGWRPEVDKALLEASLDPSASTAEKAALVKLANKDRVTQLKMSLVRARIDMEEGSDWKSYKSAIIKNPSLKKVKLFDEVLDDAESIYKERAAEIKRQSKTAKKELAKSPPPGAEEMASENRVYEEVLKTVFEKRLEYENSREAYLKDKSDKSLLAAAGAYVELRKILSKGCMFANEAYLTPGSVVGVVMNKQMLSRDFKPKEGEGAKGQKRKLYLTPHEHYQMLNEQFGRIFHQLHADEDTPILAMRKSGKYIHRFFNAAKQMVREKSPEADFVIASRDSGKTPVKFEELRKNSRTLEGLKKGREITKSDSKATSFPKIAEKEIDERTLKAVEALFGEDAIKGSKSKKTVNLKEVRSVLCEWKVNIDEFYWTGFGESLAGG